MELKNSKAMWVPESVRGVCLWEVETEQGGTGFLASEPGMLLSIEGIVGDKRIETEIERAARYWLSAGPNDYIGKPYWISGARKVTNSEYDDQMERLLDGKVPDWEEEWREAVRDKRVQ